MEMDIYSKKGTKVTVTKRSIKNGLDYVKSHAKMFLEVGNIYTIHKTIVHAWSTEVYLKEIPNIQFNSVSFEMV